MFSKMVVFRRMYMKNNKKPRFRHELKYIITDNERNFMTAKLKQILQHDKHAQDGKYMIRSLYFDDIWDTAYEEKMLGTVQRQKYRIRNYNCSDKTIKLERKTKRNQYIYKEMASLTREETESILNGEYRFLLEREESLCKEFYVECTTNLMRPKVIVDYDREPFIMPEGDVRITFDTDIRAGLLSYDIFDSNLPTISTMPKGELVLEVKFTEFLPQIIRNILPTDESRMMAVSKYVLCRDIRKSIGE